MTWLDEVILGASGLTLLYFTAAWVGAFVERVVSLTHLGGAATGAGPTGTPGRV
jgi:hypothetical protein